ncbi:MAG: hypothetical protein QM715_15255 [Nibricoccus sp.]
MSYPGANGFSLRRDELEARSNREIWRFLIEAVGYGDLVSTPHTTKNKRGEQRIKFYLNPVLSPIFQIPAAHTKEPLYWHIDKLLEIARAAEILFTTVNLDNKRSSSPRRSSRLKQMKTNKDWQEELPLF